MFSVASDSSYLREPDLLYTFSVVDGKYRLVMDTKEVVVSDEYKVRGGIYSVFNNGKYIFVDVGLQQQEERKRVLSWSCGNGMMKFHRVGSRMD